MRLSFQQPRDGSPEERSHPARLRNRPGRPPRPISPRPRRNLSQPQCMRCRALLPTGYFGDLCAACRTIPIPNPGANPRPHDLPPTLRVPSSITPPHIISHPGQFTN